MKKYLLTLVVIGVSFSSFAQWKKKEEEKSGFDLNRLFAGGSIALGYGTGGVDGSSSFVIGANPEVGYTVAEWLDAGVAFNAIYNSIKYTDPNTLLRIKQTSFNYGAGVFLRGHPFSSFFVQVQPEYNWIAYKSKLLDMSGEIKETVNAASFLVGVGYGQRVVGEMNIFTVIMFDLATEKYSPYRDGYGRAVPIIRGGINFYFGKGKKR